MNAGVLLQRLHRGLKMHGATVAGKQRQEYFEDMKQAIEDGVDHRKIQEAVDRVVDEWPRIQLSFNAALSDVVGVRSTPSGGASNQLQRWAGAEHILGRMSEKQEVMLATVQQLTREGMNTAQIVERILGPRTFEGEEL